jgi:hypothetical protein
LNRERRYSRKWNWREEEQVLAMIIDGEFRERENVKKSETEEEKKVGSREIRKIAKVEK